MTVKDKLRKYSIILTTWEYWPWGIVYTPIYIYYLWNVIRCGKWFYFSAVNPTMYNGGFFGNKKTEMYDLLPADSYPKYELVNANFNLNQLEIVFPCIVKPNVGERGFGIKKINNLDELKSYQANCNYEFLIQEYCNYKNELSVFCIKDIRTNTFFTTSIIGKKLLSIVGDGKHTLLELISKNKNSFLQIERLQAKWGKLFDEIIPTGKELFLIDNANHSKGAIFNSIDEKKDEISSLFIHLSKQINGFNYGRFDVKYNTIDELLEGKYSIIELNGVGAEPIDMYIPKLSLWKGLSILVYHWKKMYEIAQYNMNSLQIKPMNKKEGFELLRQHSNYKGKEMW